MGKKINKIVGGLPYREPTPSKPCKMKGSAYAPLGWRMGKVAYSPPIDFRILILKA